MLVLTKWMKAKHAQLAIILYASSVKAYAILTFVIPSNGTFLKINFCAKNVDILFKEAKHVKNVSTAYVDNASL